MHDVGANQRAVDVVERCRAFNFGLHQRRVMARVPAANPPAKHAVRRARSGASQPQPAPNLEVADQGSPPLGAGNEVDEAAE